MEEFGEVEVLGYGNGSAGFVYAHGEFDSYSELGREYEATQVFQGCALVGLFLEAMLSVLTEEVRRHETSRWPLIYLERVLVRIVMIESSKKLSFVVAAGLLYPNGRA